MLREVRKRWLARTGADEVAAYDRALETGGPLEGPEIPGYTDAGPEEPVKVEDRVLAGFGWQRDDVKLVQQMAANGAEPIGSLGYDGPLAALSPERQNLADYFKETVAVVTNPAIDREREIEHFSTRAVFGRRPPLDDPSADTQTIETDFPVILGGHHDLAPLPHSAYRRIANEQGTYLLEDLWAAFGDRAKAIDIALLESETTQGAIERLKPGGGQGGQRGRRAARAHRPHRLRRRPPLHRSAPRDLRDRPGAEAVRGRAPARRTCAGAARSCCARPRSATSTTSMLALGLGANGVCPYVMVEVICVDDYENDVANLCSALRKGIEKVISTIGIHEVRGYARQFSSIGIKPELAEIFQTEAFAASEKGGTGFAAARRRHRRAPQDPHRRRGGEAGQDLPLLPQGLQGGDRRRQRHRELRGVLAEGARARGRRARSRCATSWA